jgi:hypothetical protein
MNLDRKLEVLEERMKLVKSMISKYDADIMRHQHNIKVSREFRYLADVSLHGLQKEYDELRLEGKTE